MVRPFSDTEGVRISLFHGTVETPGPGGERPEAPVLARPPIPWHRRAVVALAALAVALGLNVIELKLAEQDAVPTRPTRLGSLANDMGPFPKTSR